MNWRLLQILEVRKEKGHHYIAMGNCGQARPNRTTTQVMPVLPIGKRAPTFRAFAVIKLCLFQLQRQKFSELSSIFNCHKHFTSFRGFGQPKKNGKVANAAFSNGFQGIFKATDGTQKDFRNTFKSFLRYFFHPSFFLLAHPPGRIYNTAYEELAAKRKTLA